MATLNEGNNPSNMATKLANYEAYNKACTSLLVIPKSIFGMIGGGRLGYFSKGSSLKCIS